jgi:membrane protease YdiL (CAAX protease family)
MQPISNSNQQAKVIAEVSMVFLLVLGLLIFLRWKMEYWLVWEEIYFGHNGITRSIIFVFLPVSFILLQKDNLFSFGLGFNRLTYGAKLALWSSGAVAPACISFSLISWLNLSPTSFLGAFLLTIAFSIALLAVLLITRRLPNTAKSNQRTHFGLVILLIFLSLGLSYWLFPTYSKIVAIFNYFVFVGLSEEILFRGYIQSRLNQSFGKPFRLFRVDFGVGLFISAILFGLLHGFNTHEFSWWALFPIPMGMIFGFLREKEGGLIACTLLHGMVDWAMS